MARLVVVTGKGGVGKTVVAAATGRRLADAGHRVLILEADPRENLHHLFGADPSGGAVVKVDRSLAIRNANPRLILDDVVRHTLRVGALSRRVLASPIYQHFADSAPGLKEMMLLGYALQVTEGKADTKAAVVVLDAPASGHGLSLLASPLLVADVITTGPLGKMARRIAGMIADAGQTEITLVTLAEEMPVQETFETAEQIEARLGRPVTRVVANALWPALPREAPGDDVHALWTARRAHNERELARLRRRWPSSLAEVPLIGADFGPALLAGAVEALGA